MEKNCWFNDANSQTTQKRVTDRTSPGKNDGSSSPFRENRRLKEAARM
jgi:hypothetical protein